MTTEIIHLSVPKSIKGQWVAHCRKNGLKLVPWIVDVIERSFDQPLQNAHSTDSLGEPGEAKATIIIEAPAGTRARWTAKSQAESLRLTDWVVNRIILFQ